MRALLATVALLATPSALMAANAGYKLSTSISLGAPDRWDYVVFDAPTDRVYVAHGDRLAVVDAKTERLVGNVEGVSGGTHGAAVSLATGEGFTDDGEAGQVIAFDLKTLKTIRRIAANTDADGLALDPLTGHLFVVEGDPKSLTVVDTKTDKAVGKISAGEKLEYAVADGKGAVYVAGEANSDIIKIATRNNRIVARWSTPACDSPHGLAFDPRTERLFMGCKNSVMVVVDARSGRTVSKLPIGRGNDAVAFDGVRKRVFSSNGVDGTVSAYQQITPDRYIALPTITTMVSARTMSIDPASGRLFIAGADTSPSDVPGGRPKVKSGTLRLLIFRPVS